MKRTLLLFLLCLFLLFFGLSHFEPSKAENESSNEVLVHKSFSQQGDKSDIEPIRPGAINIFSSFGPGRVQGTDETFARLIIKAKSKGPVRVIVGLNTAFLPEESLPNAQVAESQRDGIAQAQDSLIAQLMGLNISSITRFTFIPFIAMELDAAGLTFLQNSSEVLSIEEDLPIPLALAESVPLIGGTAAWASGFSGAGQTVAILDTGVDKTHSFMSGKVVSEACYSTTNAGSTSVCPGGVTESTSTGSGVNCSVSMNQDCKHGTHVAGIAAGEGTTVSGVAKDANIISIQVFSQPVGGGSLLAFPVDVIKGLERVQQLSGSFNIAAVNMSFGGSLFSTNCDSTSSAMKNAIDNLRSINIATVIASGNSGSTNGTSFPACISSAISTGSTDDGSLGTTVNTVSDFSNSASFLKLLAPGRWINSSVPGGGFENFSGTSMAAPHVAGAWAVLKSKAPSATVDQVLQALTTTGLSVTDSRNGITKPRIKVDAALTALGTNSHVLTIASSNPNSGVNIAVSPNDNSNLGSGTTQFTLTYNHNTNVNLTAPATAGGNNFLKWQRNGMDWSFSQATNVTLDANYTMTAVYVTPPRTLTVSSTNPSSGVNITVSPNDNSGFGNGATQFSRTYSHNTNVSLTALATAGANNFLKWQRNGLDWSFSQATNVTLDANYTMTAVYVTPPPINVALAANGAVATAQNYTQDGVYPGLHFQPSYAIDGTRFTTPVGDHYWRDEHGLPSWVQIDFDGPKTIREVDVFTHADNYQTQADPDPTQTFANYGTTAFTVQYWTGSAWATVPGGAITGNNLVWKKITFSALTTTKIRVVANAAVDGVTRIVEVEAWTNIVPIPSPINVALAANGAVATAQNYTQDGVYPGLHFQPSYAIDGTRFTTPVGDHYWRDEHGLPSWVQIDFDGPKTIREVDVFTHADDYQTQADPDPTQTFANYGTTAFTVQYWTGSAWATVPGGAITGNNLVWKKISFSALTTTKIRVVANAAVDGVTRIVEVEAWTNIVPIPSPINVALAANGAVATAQNYTQDGVYPGLHFQPSYAIDGTRFTTPVGDHYWRDEHGLPSWVQIDFDGPKTIREVDVFTHADDYQTQADPDPTQTFANYGTTAFTVQYWTGSAWATVPGGAITGNNLVWKKITFSALTTTKIRVVANAAVDGVTRIVEIEAFATGP